MNSLTKVGKRLDNITRFILDSNPQDKWVLSNIVPMFLEAVKSSATMQEEQLIVSQLNKLLDNFEFRYNQMFEEKKKKRDRCLRIADRKFDKPSAYKSGAVVRCRKGDIWKNLKETNDPQDNSAIPYGSGYNKVMEIIQKLIQEDESLHKWFKRSGPKGKEGGWVDCNTCKDGSCKACGRKKGEKRAKYPSCRPTPSQCKTKGKGKKWGKTKENMISLKNILKEIESEKIYHIEGIILTNLSERPLQDILSDIRALPSITVVRNEEIDQDSSSSYFKTHLSIKIDPYPYIKTKEWDKKTSLNKIISNIKSTPGVVGFKSTITPYSTNK